MKTTQHTAHFGPYTLDLRSAELRKFGTKVKMGEQAFQILQMLLETPGEMVTREELRSKLWAHETFVDFDHGLNSAMQRLRDCLSDSASAPRWVETVPRRGYRFLGKVEWANAADGFPINGKPATSPDKSAVSYNSIQDSLPAADAVLPLTHSGARGTYSGRKKAFPSLPMGLVFSLLCLLSTATWLLHRYGTTSEPEFHRLSFGRGVIHSARFTPDGENVIYGAAWDGKPSQLFWTKVGSPESRPLDVEGDILAISSSGEMAVLQRETFGEGSFKIGTLALVSQTGGAPRSVLHNVGDADWSPDGSKLLVTHFARGHCLLEYPLGKVIYETGVGAWISHPRISPQGDKIAFLEHPLPEDDSGSVAMVDLTGKKQILGRDFSSMQGVAWTFPGDAIWFSAIEARSGGGRSLFTVTTSGELHLVRRESGNLDVHDTSRDGHLLMTRDSWRDEVYGRIYPEQKDRDLGRFDNSYVTDLTPDGATLLLSVQGEATSKGYEVYIRGTRDGSEATRLGQGYPNKISPNGNWVVAIFPWGVRPSAAPQLLLLPTGTGQPRTVTHDSISHLYANWLPDGRRLVFIGNEPGHDLRSWIQDLEGSQPVPITPEGTYGASISPDGKWLVAVSREGKVGLYPLDQGKPKPLSGPYPDEEPICWSKDGRYLFVANRGPVTTVTRVEIMTGRRDLLYTLGPPDPAGVVTTWPALVTSDGKSYVYSYFRVLSDLYEVTGIGR